ncbi:MAG: hypothetical protein PHD61_11415 [Bacteroidales bacterium]|nr:hypothetical protein [Lentimicrobiaceae bacterium]MDD5695897.1 hypothetical protein [Bacteroidales bacterium]
MKSNILRVILPVLLIIIISSCDSSYPPSNNKQSKYNSINDSIKTKNMKRNSDGSLYYESTNIYTVIGHVFDTKFSESILYLPYEKVKLFTNAGTVLTAAKYVKGDGNFENYTKSESGEKLFKSREFLPYENIPSNRDFTFNCFGQCFCDGKFWLNLLTGEEETLIKDNKLDSSDNLNEIKSGSIILFYYKNQLIHGILVNPDNELLSKDGTKTLIKYSDFYEFKEKTDYIFDKIRILN